MIKWKYCFMLKVVGDIIIVIRVALQVWLLTGIITQYLAVVWDAQSIRDLNN